MNIFFRIAKRLLFFVLLISLSLEFSLQVCSLSFIRDRILKTNGAIFHRADGSKKTIVCVGDSCTFGIGASRYKSYPAQLYALLEAQGNAVTVINKGVPGANSTQIMQILKKSMALDKPDIALVMMGVNDHWNFGDVQRNSISAEGRDGYSALLTVLSYSKLYKLVQESIMTKRMQTLLRDQYICYDNQALSQWIHRKWFLKNHRERFEANREFCSVLLSNNVDAMEEIAMKNHCKIIYVSYMLPQSNVLMRELVREKRLEEKYIAVDDMYESIGSEKERLLSDDAFHPNPQGYELMARVIHDYLVQRELL